MQANIDLLHIHFIDSFFNTNSIRISGFKSIQANFDLLHIHFIDLFLNRNLIRMSGFKSKQQILIYYIYTLLIFF